MSWEFRWASSARAHGLPLPAELEAEGWLRIAQHPVYSSSWLLWRAVA